MPGAQHHEAARALRRGPLSRLLGVLAEEGDVRGECTLVIAGAAREERNLADATADARLLLDRGAPARAVQDLLVARHGLSRRTAYALILELRDG